MKFTPTQSQIDQMKQNKEAFMFWPKELQDWAKENCKEFVLPSNLRRCRDDDFEGIVAYRLLRDFELPKAKRWFVHPETGSINIFSCVENQSLTIQEGMFEVNESELPYYERPEPIKGFEWRLMKPDGSCEWIDMDDDGTKFAEYLMKASAIVKEPRWCKAPVKKEPIFGWKEYTVEVHGNNEYVVIGYRDTPRLPLYMAQGCVGFGGVQFKEQVLNRWYLCISGCMDAGGVIWSEISVRDTLSIPCKVRFWEEVTE